MEKSKCWKNCKLEYICADWKVNIQEILLSRRTLHILNGKCCKRQLSSKFMFCEDVKKFNRCVYVFNIPVSLEIFIFPSIPSRNWLYHFILKLISGTDDLQSKILKCLIQTNIENMLLAVMAVNYCVLMIDLVNLLSLL